MVGAKQMLNREPGINLSLSNMPKFSLRKDLLNSALDEKRATEFGQLLVADPAKGEALILETTEKGLRSNSCLPLLTNMELIQKGLGSEVNKSGCQRIKTVLGQQITRLYGKLSTLEISQIQNVQREVAAGIEIGLDLCERARASHLNQSIRSFYRIMSVESIRRDAEWRMSEIHNVVRHYSGNVEKIVGDELTRLKITAPTLRIALKHWVMNSDLPSEIGAKSAFSDPILAVLANALPHGSSAPIEDRGVLAVIADAIGRQRVAEQIETFPQALAELEARRKAMAEAKEKAQLDSGEADKGLMTIDRQVSELKNRCGLDQETSQKLLAARDCVDGWRASILAARNFDPQRKQSSDSYLVNLGGLIRELQGGEVSVPHQVSAHFTAKQFQLLFKAVCRSLNFGRQEAERILKQYEADSRHTDEQLIFLHE